MISVWGEDIISPRLIFSPKVRKNSENMKNISKKFAKTLDKRILPCYNVAVARISAEAHGTLMITVSDLRLTGNR